MHGLRVPATAKEKGNPLGAPAKKNLASLDFFRDPVFSFLFVPASHSPCICFTSTFIKKKHKINTPEIWERDIFRVSLFACLIRNTKMYRKKMREWKRTQACIEGALALSHQKNPRIFGCAAGENRRIFSQNPARPQACVLCNGSIFFSVETSFFTAVAGIRTPGVCFYVNLFL